MDAIVLCGGEGSRFAAAVEKPLFPVGGVAMVDRVLAAVRESEVDDVYAAVSPNAPETRTHLHERDVRVVETPGEGYVADLGHALAELERPVLTVAADLPLLVPEVVDDVLAEFASGGTRLPDSEQPSLSVCVHRSVKHALGVRADATVPTAPELAPSGLNVVAEGDDRYRVSWDARLAVNVNRRSDAAVAERLSGAVHESEPLS